MKYMYKKKVCIVCINYNALETTKKCISSLKKVTKYDDYNITILDNGSIDNSYQELKKIKNIDLIRSNTNLGYTKGINLLWEYCIKKYNPDYICNMNNDIITIQSDWLSLMIDTLDNNKHAMICGNKLIFPDGRLQMLFLERKIQNFDLKDKGQFNFIRETKAVGGANMLIKTQLIKEIGGLDENYFFGPDDIDYCMRAVKLGYKVIYNGFSKSIHIGSFSYKSAKKDFIYRHQSYGLILFSLRYDKNKIKMIFKELVRVFLTRKDPYAKKELKNIYFHKTFFIRFIYWIQSVYLAIKNYKNIKCSRCIK